jgi:hypothetical protein
VLIEFLGETPYGIWLGECMSLNQNTSAVEMLFYVTVFCKNGKRYLLQGTSNFMKDVQILSLFKDVS